MINLICKKYYPNCEIKIKVNDIQESIKKNIWTQLFVPVFLTSTNIRDIKIETVNDDIFLLNYIIMQLHISLL